MVEMDGVTFRRHGDRYEVLVPFGIGQRRIGAVEKVAPGQWAALVGDAEVGIAGTRDGAALILTLRA